MEDWNPIPAREPARGHYGSLGDLAFDGLRRQRLYVTGARRPPAMHHLTGLAPTHVAPGRSTFSMPASPWVYGAFGTISGGMLAFVADAPLSGSVISELGPGQVVTTAELSLAFVRPATADAASITAESTSIHVGSTLGLSSCEVKDASGRLLAHATARNVVLEAPSGWQDAPEAEQYPVDPAAQGAAPEDEAPDPWRRPVEGEVLPARTWEERSGLELAEAWCAGELPFPPVGALTGIRPVEAREGAVVWTAPASGWWCSPAPFLYGGMLAHFAETALTSVCQTLAPAGRVAATLDLTVRFLRPVFPDGSALEARAEVVHRGRSLVVARAEVTGGDGRPAVLAECSAALVAPSALLRGPTPSGLDDGE